MALDPVAQTLTKAIGYQEGGGKLNYNALGDSGKSAGAYQWNNGKQTLQTGGIPANFRSDAQKYGLNPNDFSPANQNQVAYTKVKSYLDKGFKPSQIASMWNAGEGEPNAYTGQFSNGSASSTPTFDVPGYTKGVQKYAQQLWGQQGQSQGSQQQAPQSAPDNRDFLQKAGDIVNSIFPGKQVGAAIGTLGGYGMSQAQGTGQYYDTSAPSPLQTIGDVAQGALMVGSGMPEGTEALSIFGKDVPVLSAAKTGLGRIVQNTGIGAGYGLTGALAGGQTDPSELLKQGALGGAVGGVAGVAGEALSSALDKFPSRLVKSVLPQLNNEDTINYAINKVKLGTPEAMVSESQKALDSFNKQIQAIIEHPQYANAGESVAADILTGVKTDFPNSEYEIPSIVAKLKTQVPGEAALLTKIGNGQPISLDEMNTLRQALDKASYKMAIDSPEIRAGKELAGSVGNALRNKVKQVAPETAAIFDDYAKEIRLWKALKILAKKNGKGSLVKVNLKELAAIAAAGTVGGPVGAAVAAAAEKVGESPAVRLGAAKVITKATPSLKNAGMVANKVATLAPGAIAAQTNQQ